MTKFSALKRNTRRGIYEQTRTLFSAAPIAEFSRPFNVYNEEDMNAGTTHVQPAITIVDALVEPRTVDLPIVIVEMTDFMRLNYEMGNSDARVFSIDWNVFGASRGSRDDISSYLQEYFPRKFDVLDLTVAGSPVIGRAEAVTDEIDVTTITTNQDVGAEGSLRNFDVLTADYILLLG